MIGLTVDLLGRVYGDEEKGNMISTVRYQYTRYETFLIVRHLTWAAPTDISEYQVILNVLSTNTSAIDATLGLVKILR